MRPPVNAHIRAAFVALLLAPAPRMASTAAARAPVEAPAPEAPNPMEADSARGRFRLLLAPVHATPIHESRWGRDAGAALRRELAAIPWIDVVDPRPDALGRPREVA